MKFYVQCRGDSVSKEIKSKFKSYLSEFDMDYDEEEPETERYLKHFIVIIID